VAAWKFLLFDSPKDFTAIFKAHIDFYKKVGRFKEKRKRNIKEKQKSYSPPLYHTAIIWQHFVRKKKTFAELKGVEPKVA